jgi:hypothetical protein
MTSHALKYAALTDWGEDHIYLDVIGPNFRTHEKAEAFARDAELSLYLHQCNEEITLTLVDADGKSINLARSQVRIRYNAKAASRISLDPRQPEQIRVILDSLDDLNSPYHISEDDLIPVDWSFEQLAGALSAFPRRFGLMAYGVENLGT